MTNYTQEEPEAAADMFSGEMMRTQNILDIITIPCGDRVTVLRAGIETQAALTRSEAEASHNRKGWENVTETLEADAIALHNATESASRLRREVWEARELLE